MRQGLLFTDEPIGTPNPAQFVKMATIGMEGPPISACSILDTAKDRKVVPFTDADSPKRADPIFIPQADDDEHDWGEFDSCLTEFGTNHCRLEGQPARIIGTPRTAPYATIEPVDLDVEPIGCCWHVVDMVMKESGAFCRDDDDTDE